MDSLDQQTIITYATSGKVSTSNFGEKFNIENFYKKAKYSLSIMSPYEGKWDKDSKNNIYNQEYNVKITYDVESNLECVYLDKENTECLNENEKEYLLDMKIALGNQSINFGKRSIMFSRNFETKEQWTEWKNKRFTGFTVQWNCSNCQGETSAYNRNFNIDTTNKNFGRMANIVHYHAANTNDIWRALMSTKSELHTTLLQSFKKGKSNFWDSQILGTYSNRKNMYDLFFENMEAKLNLSKGSFQKRKSKNVG